MRNIRRTTNTKNSDKSTGLESPQNPAKSNMRKKPTPTRYIPKKYKKCQRIAYFFLVDLPWRVVVHQKMEPGWKLEDGRWLKAASKAEVRWKPEVMGELEVESCLKMYY